MPHLLDKKNADMLIGLGVFTRAELESRCEIMLDNYNKAVQIEANTMIAMVKEEIAPAVSAYAASLANTIRLKKDLQSDIPYGYECTVLKKLSCLNDGIMTKTATLEEIVVSLQEINDTIRLGYAIRDRLLPEMSELRILVDQAETLTAKSYWPYPSYGDILFSVR